MKKRFFKQLLALVCTLALLASFTTALAADQFTDVTNAYWAHDEIQYVVDKGLFNGTTATTFAPESQMKRGQLAAVLYRYAGSPKVSGTSGYTDVSADRYYADAVTWAKQNDIFLDDKLNATKLNPDEGITRSEFAVMLYNFAVLNGKADVDNNASNPFTDMKNVSNEIKTAMVNWAVPAGILNGTSGSTMNPFGAIKRSHVAAMLYRYDTLIANPGSVVEEPEETPSTPSTSNKDVYTAGDTLTLKRGGTYNVEIGVGEKVYLNDQLGEAWSSFDHNKFVDGKRVATVEKDFSKNAFMIVGNVASDVTLQFLSGNDFTTVLATVNVTVTGGSSSSGGNTGNTGSGTTSGDLDDYMDIREEIVRLTNEVRQENGVAALPTDSKAMDAAQAIAEEYLRTESYVNGHDGKLETDTARGVGITYGFGSNLLYGPILNESQVAEIAMNEWKNSSGHFRTMIDSTVNNIGVGVARNGNTWVCIQFFGDLDSTLGTYN